MTQYPSSDYLLECFDFREIADEHSEKNIHLFWRERPLTHFKTLGSMKHTNGQFSGLRAGCIHEDGRGNTYRRLKIGSIGYPEHRCIYIALVDSLVPSEIEIDHWDQNGLNNSLENLRFSTSKQNNYNRGLFKNNLSRYIGVSWYSRYEKWRARIRVGGRLLTLGYFTDRIQAVLAYDAAARMHHKEFAFLNFAVEGSEEKALHYLSFEQFQELGAISI